MTIRSELLLKETTTNIFMKLYVAMNEYEAIGTENKFKTQILFDGDYISVKDNKFSPIK